MFAVIQNETSSGTTLYFQGFNVCDKGDGIPAAYFSPNYLEAYLFRSHKIAQTTAVELSKMAAKATHQSVRI